MEKISNLLKDKKFEKPLAAKKINLKFEKASEFAKYVELNPIFVLKLFKLFGEEKVLGLRSWIKDYDCKDKKSMIYWKLKELFKTSE